MIDVNEPIYQVGGWDEYFYGICRAVAKNSKCFSRRIGAILVRDKSVFSTGYNGPPRGVPPCDQRWYTDTILFEKYHGLPDPEKARGQCPRRVLGLKSGEGVDLCPAGHAEENAILNAARMGIETKGSIMYMTCGIPCAKCLVKIINAGVEELIVTSHTIYDDSTLYLLDTSDIKVRLFDFL